MCVCGLVGGCTQNVLMCGLVVVAHNVLMIAAVWELVVVGTLRNKRQMIVVPHSV